MNLKGVEKAGTYRANAVGRLVEWSEKFYKDELEPNDILPSDVLAFLDEPGELLPKRREVKDLNTSNNNKSIASLLLFVTYSPQAVPLSTEWKEVADAMGEKETRTIIIWWSIRYTLKMAKGLN